MHEEILARKLLRIIHRKRKGAGEERNGYI
jgi:hypothetical protein